MTENATTVASEEELRCAGTTTAGDPCRVPARLVDPETGYCRNHQPPSEDGEEPVGEAPAEDVDQPEAGTPEKDKLSDPAVPDAEERRFRIERLYMAMTLQQHPHGSKAWLARLIDVRPKTVRRWTWPQGREDARTPEPETWKKVVAREDDVADERLAEAGEQLKKYHRENPESSLDWEQFD